MIRRAITGAKSSFGKRNVANGNGNGNANGNANGNGNGNGNVINDCMVQHTRSR